MTEHEERLRGMLTHAPDYQIGSEGRVALIRVRCDDLRALLSHLDALRAERDAQDRVRAGIYIASKTRHADRWRVLRDVAGYPIVSSWIDEAGPGESASLSDLWTRCIKEASSCAVLILFREGDDMLKGAWIEMGAALAAGIPVYAIGIEAFTFADHPGIRHFESMRDAIAALPTAVKNGEPS